MRRLIFHPLAAPIIIALLMLDFWKMTTPPGFVRGPSLRLFLSEEASPPHGPDTYDAFYYEEGQEEHGRYPDGWRLLKNPWAGDVMGPSAEAEIQYRATQEADGFWAVTTLHRCYTISPGNLRKYRDDPPSPPLTAAGGTLAPTLAAARRAFVRTVVAQESALPPAALKLLETRDYSEDRIIWTGYLHDAGAAVLVLCLPFALVGLGRFLLIPRADDRLRRGLCVACGYDLAGLPPGAACPECGKARAAEQQMAERG